MNAIAKVQETLPGIPAEPAASMFQLIMRAVQDPACDPVKMAQLLELSRQVRADDAKAAYTRALVIMKPLLPIIDRKGRIVIHEKSKEKIKANEIQSTAYALWEDIDAAITPLLAKHGFVLTFRCGAGAEGRITVTGVLSHEEGHSEETTMTLPLDTSGSKNNVQAVGSSTSYGKRYTASLLLNLRTKGEDDDGKLGGDPGPISIEQVAALQDLLDRSHSDIEKFCKYMGVDALIHIPASGYSKALEALNLALDAWQKKQTKGTR
jgi:hypothetical protein